MENTLGQQGEDNRITGCKLHSLSFWMDISNAILSLLPSTKEVFLCEGGHLSIWKEYLGVIFFGILYICSNYEENLFYESEENNLS